MTQPLNEFICAVRIADNIEQEKFIIRTEQAQIRAYLRKCTPEMRPRIVSKIIFLDMLGENPVWGQMEAITLMTDDRYSYKRVGYIGAAILLDESAELTILVTQTLTKDLQSTDPNIQCLSLAFIANLGSQECCRSVTTHVQKLLSSMNPAVQKAAGMAACRIISKNPDLAESFKNSVQSLLNSSYHGVILAGMNLTIQMMRAEPKLAQIWHQFTIPFTKILKSLVYTRPSPEFASGIYNDPFMQIKAMQALAMLKKENDELETILQSIISTTEYKRNTGRALLYQAVETVCAITKKASLRGHGFNQIGRLLSLKNPNILYSALSAYARILTNDPRLISRGGADSMAIQRYKNAIVKCLDNKDPSVRRRALDVISALIDEKNVETLIPEILGFVKLSDSEFRAELIYKIYTATQKFAPNLEWNFDTVHKILIDSGNYVNPDIISSFCELITKNPSIHSHAVSKLSESIFHYNENQSLIQVSAFVIGEFSEDPKIVDALVKVLALPQTVTETKLYLITAISKLAARFNDVKQLVIETLTDTVKSNTLEVQQRSGEMLKMLSLGQVGEQLLAPIAIGHDTELDEKAVAIKEGTENSKADDEMLLNILDTAPSQQQQQKPQQSALDLLGLGTPSNPPPTNPTPSNPLDLLSLAPSPSPQPQKPVQQPVQQPTAPQQPVQQQAPQQPPLQLVMQDVAIRALTQVNKSDPRQMMLKVTAISKSDKTFTNFQFQFQASPACQIKVQAPDGNVVGPNKPVSVIVFHFNPQNVPFALNVKVSYYYGAMPVTDAGVLKY
ncbi:Adaptin N terminal region family protein [Trichomonas vaginalis G3]|uniref:AP-1 complex subunit gamma n=1 Tax=Trichomonas vaginalis (strain ATCC PRA-98 / G3) TaxID=412133 RepID=A2E4F8_TRIV3|nr:intracellular protein transport [Trichomonas vaginalis G3]EAY12493.1 Adaptin N terminal region family protein [Trichomonas vaginalis G3]KAI5539554.1 intracellular protein transport [Trichomonas vaginalis G3]|eukprot:XP_001324716.1 Adaptin N terminal region family protein [Trichomonas vaginalis G3]